MLLEGRNERVRALEAEHRKVMGTLCASRYCRSVEACLSQAALLGVSRRYLVVPGSKVEAALTRFLQVAFFAICRS